MEWSLSESISISGSSCVISCKKIKLKNAMEFNTKIHFPAVLFC